MVENRDVKHLADPTQPSRHDVVWLLTACGPETLARRFVDKGLHQTDFGAGSLTYLAEIFKTPEHTGPKGWVIESGFEGEEAARESRQGAGVVGEFLRLEAEYGGSAPKATGFGAS